MRGGRTERVDYKLLEAVITLWPLPSFIQPIRINLCIVGHVYVAVIVYPVVFSIKFYEFNATLVARHVCM